MEQYGIIGHPLGHSLSPALHNWGFARWSMDAVYDFWDTPPDSLAAFVDRVRAENIRGVSVTIPHKRTIMPLLDRVSTTARAIGAVNTICWDEHGRLRGTNTDVAGCLEPLRRVIPKPKTALVLGAGGAARAAIAALNQLGVEWVGVSNRNPEKADALALEFSIHAVRWDERHKNPCDVLVNATPLGMSGPYQGQNPWPMKALPQDTTVFDLVYNPLETPLLALAKTCGCGRISGLEMFLHQGLKQFHIWTGQDLDPDAARERLLQELG
ncbi:shikimate dehydrogenase [Paucidesulfovibrio gracilis DSM 16080]|uniref:Shikimate dehydrogenase (NADP(+)) n=1 Tax=Paucidesulfovibrio gracilis DSM 16080 TaxID=1121449 RepID=A0A1T4XPI5_9BACT|nr:shikimate dehydrogenase [Paucidesulfovibrio gracilis]SKA91041.1 shikimate dehydrogenase [Paucidesulfovibrio gracilis DSM 16080]